MADLTAEDRCAFQTTVRRLLSERSAEADVRRAMELEVGYDRDLWNELASLGLTGLIVDEDHGGIGADAQTLELVMEEVGAALLCSPFLSSSVLAVGLLQALDDLQARARLLPGIADGSRIATVALTGHAGTWTEAGIEVSAAQHASDWRLDGRASYVTHGQIADVLLVVARGPGGAQIFEVDPHASGIVIKPLPTFDHTLRLAEVVFTDVEALPITTGRPAWDVVEDVLDLARVALAGEQAGGGRRVLEFTVEYAKSRIQFGRPIGSFQAIKHMAADLLLEAESAISAARHAAKSLTEKADDAKAAIALASFVCAEAFCKITADAIQMHGGIAFTWDHPAHLYLRRARADAQLFGSPAFYRERFIQQLEAADA